MAFVNTTFPDLKLKHGITKTVLDPVIITGNGTREVRRRQNQFDRYVWNIPARTLTEADKQSIFAFLRTVNMGQDSFLFRDPTYPTFTDVKLPTDPILAIASTRQLCIPYGVPDGSSLLSSRLKHPLYSGTGYTFKRNGVTTTGTSIGVQNGFLNYSFPSTSDLNSITVSGEVKLQVRFQGSSSWTIAAMSLPSGGNCASVTPSVVELGDFQLVEVFE